MRPDVGMAAARGENFSKSKVLGYHLIITEVFQSHPQASKERARTCFEVMDSIAADGGAVAEVLKLLVGELRGLVYSGGFTVKAIENKESNLRISKHELNDQAPDKYENIPYCILVQRLKKQHAREKVALEKTVASHVATLQLRKEDLDLLYRKNIAITHNLESTTATLSTRDEMITQLKNDIEILRAEKGGLEIYISNLEERYMKEMGELQAANSQAAAQLEMLALFQAPTTEHQDNTSHTETIFKRTEIQLTPAGLLKYDINQSNQVEKQFAEMLNSIMEDFENALTQIYRKREIKFGAANDDPKLLEEFKKNIAETIATYRPKLDKYLEELSRLRTHGEALRLQEKKNISNQKLPSLDPVNVVTRKFGVILSTSTNGEKFYLLDECSFCIKCGDKMLSCPHLDLPKTHILLPPNTNYISLTRPLLKIKSIAIHVPKKEDSRIRLTEDEAPDISPAFFRIWRDYYNKRGGEAPIIKRNFALKQVLAFILEIYETKWRWEVQDQQPLETMLDSFYRLLTERFTHKEIYLRAAYDIFTGLQALDNENDHVTLFVQQLGGAQEEYWKYLHIIRRLFFSGPSNELLDKPKFRRIIKYIYPDRAPEQYDQFELEFISYCKNRISNDSVMDHIAHMIARRTEPNYMLMFKVLDEYDVQQLGYLTKDEFSEVMVKVVPFASLDVIDTRYKMAEAVSGKNLVAISRLAGIGAFIVIHTARSGKWAPGVINQGIFSHLLPTKSLSKIL